MLGRLFGIFPFSVAELLLYLLIILVVVWLVTQCVGLVRKPEKMQRFFQMLATIGCLAGIGYFAFTILCGLNYHRVTFADQCGLEVRPSSAEELAEVYYELVVEANEARHMVRENERQVMTLANSPYQAAKQAPAAIKSIAEDYPVLGGYTPRAKPVLASRGMSWTDITGIYIPFTFEGNVNVDAPEYQLPFTMVHELAHYKGFMREDEANFIAYLACRESDDPEFVYSGLALAVIHCGNALYATDPELYFQVNDVLSPKIALDFADGAAYWRQFEGPVAEVASKMNDSYLKSNRQTDGVRSYGRMVDLVMAEYRMRHGLT